MLANANELQMMNSGLNGNQWLLASTGNNVKDNRWLTLEVCREFQRNKCCRSEHECKYAHPPPHVEVQNGRVTCCFDSIKGKCQRKDPPCKYLHPPQHLKEQLLQNGRQNLVLKALQAQIVQQQLNAYATALAAAAAASPSSTASVIPLSIAPTYTPATLASPTPTATTNIIPASALYATTSPNYLNALSVYSNGTSANGNSPTQYGANAASPACDFVNGQQYVYSTNGTNGTSPNGNAAQYGAMQPSGTYKQVNHSGVRPIYGSTGSPILVNGNSAASQNAANAGQMMANGAGAQNGYQQPVAITMSAPGGSANGLSSNRQIEIGQTGADYASLKRLALSNLHNNLSMSEQKTALFSSGIGMGATVSTASAYATQPLNAYPNGAPQIMHSAYAGNALAAMSHCGTASASARG